MTAVRPPRCGTRRAGYAARQRQFLVEGRVALTVPASWLTQRVIAGPGSARVQVTSPSDPEVALHVTQSPTSRRDADRCRRSVETCDRHRTCGRVRRLQSGRSPAPAGPRSPIAKCVPATTCGGRCWSTGRSGSASDARAGPATRTPFAMRASRPCGRPTRSDKRARHGREIGWNRNVGAGTVVLGIRAKGDTSEHTGGCQHTEHRLRPDAIGRGHDRCPQRGNPGDAAGVHRQDERRCRRRCGAGLRPPGSRTWWIAGTPSRRGSTTSCTQSPKPFGTTRPCCARPAKAMPTTSPPPAETCDRGD